MKIESMKQILKYYIDRIKNRIEKNTKKTETCWIWTGAWQGQDAKGFKKYGSISLCGHLQATHRIAYILKHGRIKNGLHVLHKCDNRFCINTDHLFLGTNNDNVQDKILKKRHAFGEKSGRAKLTKEQVIEIRNAVLSKKKNSLFTAQMLAEKYGVCRRQIFSIRWRQTWKHI